MLIGTIYLSYVNNFEGSEVTLTKMKKEAFALFLLPRTPRLLQQSWRQSLIWLAKDIGKMSITCIQMLGKLIVVHRLRLHRRKIGQKMKLLGKT